MHVTDRGKQCRLETAICENISFLAKVAVARASASALCRLSIQIPCLWHGAISLSNSVRSQGTQTRT